MKTLELSAKKRRLSTIGNLKVGDLCASLVLAFVILIICRPTATYYIGPSGILSNFETVVYFGLLVYIVVNHHFPTRFVITTWLFCLIVLFASLCNGVLTISTCNAYFKIALSVYYCEGQIKTCRNRFVNVAYGIILILCLVDVCTIVLFREGLFFDTRIENEYYTDIIPGWFLGLKNNRVLWYLCLIALAIYRDSHSNGKHRISVVACFVLALFAVTAVQSSTSILVLSVLAVLYLCSGVLSRASCIVNPGFVCVAALALWVAVVVLSWLTDLLQLLSSIFDKASTLTGRDVIWARTLDLIVQSPILGYGVQETSARVALLGGVEAVNAHNQILEILYVCGIVGLTGFILVLSTFSFGNQWRSRLSRYYTAAFLLVLFTEMISEVIITVPVFWVLLAIVRLFRESDTERSANVAFEGNTRIAYGIK